MGSNTDSWAYGDSRCGLELKSQNLAAFFHGDYYAIFFDQFGRLEMTLSSKESLQASIAADITTILNLNNFDFSQFFDLFFR
jgi:hypothetical protein